MDPIEGTQNDVSNNALDNPVVQSVPESSVAPNDAEPADNPGAKQEEPAAPVYKADKEVARLKNVISNLQAEKSAYQKQQETARTPKAQVEDVAQHPALKGLKTDEDGLVEYKGTLVTPEFVIDQFDQNQNIMALQQAHADRVEADYQAKLADANNSFVKTIADMVPGAREQLLPGLTGELAKVADDLLLETVSAGLSSVLQAGEEFNETVIEQMFNRKGEQLRALSTQMAENQFSSNQEYQTQYPAVNGKGMAGHPSQVDLSKLSRSQQEQLGRQAAALAEAARGK